MITYVNHLGEVRSMQNNSIVVNGPAKAFSFNEPSGISDLRNLWNTKHTYLPVGMSTVIMNPNHIFSVRQEVSSDTDDVSKLSDITELLK